MTSNAESHLVAKKSCIYRGTWVAVQRRNCGWLSPARHEWEFCPPFLRDVEACWSIRTVSLSFLVLWSIRFVQWTRCVCNVFVQVNSACSKPPVWTIFCHIVVAKLSGQSRGARYILVSIYTHTDNVTYLPKKKPEDHVTSMNEWVIAYDYRAAPSGIFSVTMQIALSRKSYCQLRKPAGSGRRDDQEKSRNIEAYCQLKTVSIWFLKSFFSSHTFFGNFHICFWSR